MLGEIWHLCRISMMIGLDDGGSKLLEVCVLGLFCLERLCLRFFWLPVLLLSGVFAHVFGVFRHGRQ